jgi:hypothetical protein
MDALRERRREVFGDDPRLAGLPEIVDRGPGDASVRVPVLESGRLRRWLDDPHAPDLRAGVAPEYAEFLRRHRLDHRFVRLGVPNPLPAQGLPDRRRLHIGWRGEEADWDAPDLARLFSGQGVAPPVEEMERDQGRYLALLERIEGSVVIAAAAVRRRLTDAEVREAYRALRRHPDGRSTGALHDVLWQAVAFELARTPYSAREFDAVLVMLERSVRRHQTWEGSSAYVEFLTTVLPFE